MATKIALGISAILIIAGLYVPLWYLSLVGLAVLAALFPFAGIFVGFFLDVIYGAPSFLPSVLAFPCTIGACLIGVCSFFVRRYLR